MGPSSNQKSGKNQIRKQGLLKYLFSKTTSNRVAFREFLSQLTERLASQLLPIHFRSPYLSNKKFQYMDETFF